MRALDRHWQKLTLVTLLLLPLAALFSILSQLRKAAYRCGLFKVIRVSVPVIVIGNIRIGGTGKTPVIIWLAEALRAFGATPGVVSRGYGGTLELAEVRPDSTAAQVGDEPVLIARRTDCPVYVGRDRAAAANSLLASHPSVDVILSDDGLQHYRLGRDFEIAVVDARRKFGNRMLLPAGPLREPVSRLESVDATIINGGDADMPGLGTFSMQLQGGQFRNLATPKEHKEAEHFANLNVHAVAGIGDPERFFAHLRNLGLKITPHAFPDHHNYSASDLDFANADAVLMTEKDAIKCSGFARKIWWALPVYAHIDTALAELIAQTINQNNGKTRGR